MNCNKDNALRAKEIAERKFARNDYVGAKRFALKAKELCPALNFISVFITIIDVYHSRMKIENGESDWYGVLGLEKSDSFQKQTESFHSLSDYIRASINNVVGAEGALQIVSEAYSNVTGTFWTKCSRCSFRFRYFVAIMNEEIVCKNCRGCFIAVPLASGDHPTYARSMSAFRPTSRDETSVVIALPAISTYPAVERAPLESERLKEDEEV